MSKLYNSLINNISESLKHILFEYHTSKSGDEYYTRKQDAEKEISKFKKYYKGKIVYCNCDNPEWSEIYICLKQHFHEYGLKKLIATYLPLANEDQQPYRYDYDGNKITKIRIKSGKFQDNISIINEADIIVSSPPFSDYLVREYLKILINCHKKYLFIGPLALWRKKDLIDYFKKNIVMADDTYINWFNTPSGIEKPVPCAWFTNFKLKRNDLNTGKRLKDIEQQYDEKRDILVVKYVENIPMDYDGIIATSERFITKINPKQYKILGTIDPIINGKKQHAKIVIQKRKT